MKTCIRCKQEKPETEFYRKWKDKPDLHSHCKVCSAKSCLDYSRSPKGKESKRKSDKKWSQSEAGKAHIKAYLETYIVPEISKKKRKEWAQTPEAIAKKKIRVKKYLDNGGKEMNRKYRKENQDKIKAWFESETGKAAVQRYHDSEKGKAHRSRSDQRKRELKGSLPNTLTAQEWLDIQKKYKHRCVYCGEKKELTHEHIIPLSRGGAFTKENIVPACKGCNSRRGNRPNLLELLSEPCYPKVACFCVAM